MASNENRNAASSSTAVTKDYGKRHVIVTGSARGMQVSVLKANRNIANQVPEARQSQFDLQKMDLMFALTMSQQIKLGSMRSVTSRTHLCTLQEVNEANNFFCRP
jgi:hypothetical protein